jgi:methylmalonyl-CoA mutase
LRMSTDRCVHETGARPKIFLADLAAAHGSRLALDQAANFFAVAGIEAVYAQEFGVAQETANAFRGSGCKIACICAQPPVSTEVIIEAMAELKAAAATRIYLAGREPAEGSSALLSAGVSEYIWPHCNALAILQDAMAAALPDQQG